MRNVANNYCGRMRDEKGEVEFACPGTAAENAPLPASLRALEAAYRHFAAELPRQRTGILAEPRNYRVALSEEKAAYAVFFSPNKDVIDISEANWRYEIDKEDFRILSLVTDGA